MTERQCEMCQGKMSNWQVREVKMDGQRGQLWVRECANGCGYLELTDRYPFTER